MDIVRDSDSLDATLGKRELDVMAAVWREGPGTVSEVRERLPAVLAYNTVLTILRNLEAKGFLRHTAEGRTFRYHALVSEQSARGSALSRIVERLFRGSALHLITQLVEEQPMSPDELRDVHRLLDARLRAAEQAKADARSDDHRASVQGPRIKPR